MKKLLFIVFIISLLGCEKDDNGIIQNKHKPFKIISYYSEVPDTSYITYDGINPIKIESTNRFSKYIYSSNKLIKQEAYRAGDNIPWLYLKFEYNNQNLIEKVIFYLNVNSTVEEWIGEPIDDYRISAYYAYEYLKGQVNKEYYVDHNDTTTYNEFDYDLNGNISKKTVFIQHPITKNFEKSREIYFSYDNKNHYLKDISIPTYANYSTKVNNVISEETVSYENSEIIENKYEYDSFDFPTLFVSDEDTIWKIEYIN